MVVVVVINNVHLTFRGDGISVSLRLEAQYNKALGGAVHPTIEPCE